MNMRKFFVIAAAVCSFGMMASCAAEKTEIPFGKELTAQEVFNGTEAVKPTEGFVPTIAFDSTRFAGSTGINRYMGEYTFDSESGAIEFKEPMGMTMMAGPQEEMDKEQIFVKALNDARFFKMEQDSTYVLMDAENNTLVKFK